MNKVFLGGTCNESTWREKLIPALEIEYFNPVVDDWTPECQAEEERQKNDVCNIHLYVITPKMTGVFSIAEVVESAINIHERCIFCFFNNDEGTFFTRGQIRSLEAVGNLVTKYGAVWCKDTEQVAKVLNSYK